MADQSEPQWLHYHQELFGCPPNLQADQERPSVTTLSISSPLLYSLASATYQPLSFTAGAAQKSFDGVDNGKVQYRSPFRYPGGKTWLVPYVRRWLASLSERPTEFIEPFAGGAIVGLTVAAEGFADHVTMVELDDDVAAVWQTIIDGDAEALAQRILTFELTRDSVDALLATEPSSIADKAFHTIVRNRISHGGKLAPGAGRLRRGEDGKGIGSRWYPETLYKRIVLIAEMRERLTFIHGDGMRVLRDSLRRQRLAAFIDPPYVAGGARPGRRLYRHSDLDHAELFDLANQLSNGFLMTYQDTDEVLELAKLYGLQTQSVTMRTVRNARKAELLIGRDLSWLD